ncbi:pyridoxal phosphate-dependent aminotransferase [Agaribacterium haliotis]|uniref:pyridoxal phosphate-dependent aminotransferase n=1 Tax=Agaribacterium haliotis TaxID=2013869 RepID=UPI000BB54E2E|nr:histidinol-phosphate transaminase [Agaribacterium haliotis]
MALFKQHIYKMGTYKPPLDGRDPERFTLLDFNERTVPVADEIARDIAEWVLAGRLQMYPSYGDICDQIADYCQVAAAQVMITNGSDQGIDLVFRCCCEPGSEVIVPGPSFPMYLQSAAIEAAQVHQPQYSRDRGYPLDKVLGLINAKTRVVVVSNPNNPSATSVSREAIVRLAKAAPRAAILVDECYFEYCGISVVDLVEQYPNIIVTRTFSKTWGLPSLRLGYVVSAKANIDELLKVRGPYDVNQLAIVALNSAFKHRQTIEAYIDEVMQKSKPEFEAFLDRHGLDYWPSSANFIWVFFDDAEAVEHALRAAGILVRPKDDASGRKGLRITLGTLSQTQALMQVLASVLP